MVAYAHSRQLPQHQQETIAPLHASRARCAAFEAVVWDYPWRRYSRLCDIGGAYGSLLSRLLQQCGKADGVLFDQPQARARKRLASTAL